MLSPPPDAAPELRPYQRQCLAAIRNAYLRGTRRQLVCLPTGTGKTVIFSAFPRFFGMKHRMLVLAHRDELLEQARAKILRANPHLHVSIEQGPQHAHDDSNVVVASVQTLGRSGSTRIERLATDDFRLVVVDEAHHAIAGSYRRVLEHFGLFDPGTRKLLVGFTATPKRGDGQGLADVFDDIVFARSLPEMVQSGYLAPLAGYRVETDVDLRNLRLQAGDYAAGQLARAVNVAPRNALVVKADLELLRERPTICFCANVEHAESLAERFRAEGVRAAPVTGEMPRERRAGVLADFSAGRVDVLTNCMVLTEGYDEPSVAGIILARPTRSGALYAQMVGRGTRLHPGKGDAVVVDIVDVTRAHGLVTLPSLFGLPEVLDLEGRTTGEARERFERAARECPWVIAEDATSLSDLELRCTRVDLFDLETPEELQGDARFAWVRAGANAFRLKLVRGESILLASTVLGEWEAVLERAEGAVTLAHQRRRERVLELAEAFVQRERPDLCSLLERGRPWRARPASEKQLALLRNHNVPVPPSLNQGQASHLIAMLARR